MQLATEQTGSDYRTSQPSVSSVPADQVEYVWSVLRSEIESALSKGQGDGTTVSHMLAKILTGDMQMWAMHDEEKIHACIVVSLRKTDTMTKVFVELLAGKDMDWWGDEIEQLLHDFKDLVGATCVESSCRLGLAKYLQKRGWRKKAVIMELT